MKIKVIFIILVGSLFSSTFLAADCDNISSNRNARILITKPDILYIDHNDGTVTDTGTGLMWQKCMLGLSGSDCLTGFPSELLEFNWQNAIAVANNNADYGYSDWRLPNKNELESLVENACHAPSINTSIFPISFDVWSSSPFIDDSTRAWYIEFNTGSATRGFKADIKSVRLVRGGL